MDFTLLEALCQIEATSGDEERLKDFIIKYVNEHSNTWQTIPKIIKGDGFQDNLILIFGKPKVAYYSHMDSVGFTSRYQNQLITIGSPDAKKGDIIVGNDALGPIECEIELDANDNAFHTFNRGIQPGTSLVYKPNFKLANETISSPYLDNRLGIFSLLQLAEELENGVLVFTTYEEHGGGSAAYLANYLLSTYQVSKSIIVDVTWVTEGIQLGLGPVISLRDAYIPRKSYIKKIYSLLDGSSFVYQQEVEAYGGSDGSELQKSALPIDWCFIGVAVNHPHSSQESANLFDILRLIPLLKILSTKL